MKKIFAILKGLGKQAIGGARKPLPLVGIVTAVREARKDKQWFKFAMYIVTGVYTAYLLYKGLDATEALEFITKILGILG